MALNAIPDVSVEMAPADGDAQPKPRADVNSDTVVECGHKSYGAGVRMQLDFVNISYVVKNRATGQDKQILHGISGTARSGRLFALMGGSGAGKTTLLDVLACNAYSGGKVQGRVFVNGQIRNAKAFSKMSCYVMQKDDLYASATVRESITTSALLRLPMSMSIRDKKQRVEEVIQELDLQACAETLIGDEVMGIKGISGGQKRRVSLAMELVKDPAVIFADEPTSGLDSEVALSIMDALHMLARKQRTVVCTIHQPNSDITELFDDFMLLAGGRCVYQGPWLSAVDWFTQQGFRTPTYKNPTDYFMSIIKDEAVALKLADAQQLERLAEAAREQQQAEALAAARQQQQLEDGSLPTSPSGNARSPAAAAGTSRCNSAGSSRHAGDDLLHLAPQVILAILPEAAGRATDEQQQQGRGQQLRAGGLSWRSPTRRMATDTTLDQDAEDVREGGQAGSGGGGGGGGSGAPRSLRPPAWFQCMVLCSRMLKNWLRSPVMLASEFSQYVFISLFVGLMYLRQFTLDADGVYNRAACIWFAFAVMSFTPSFTAITSFSNERHLLSRELKQRQYTVTPFFLARTIIILPFQMAQCLAFTLIMYFFVGFQAVASKFFIFFIVLLLFQLISEGIGLLCTVGTRHPTYAVILNTFILLLMLSFSGFLMTQIPVYFIWVNKASFLTYAYTALMQSELQGLRLKDPMNPETTVDGSTMLTGVLDNGLSMQVNIGILAAYWFGMELLKLSVMHLAHHLELL